MSLPRCPAEPVSDYCPAHSQIPTGWLLALAQSVRLPWAPACSRCSAPSFAAHYALRATHRAQGLAPYTLPAGLSEGAEAKVAGCQVYTPHMEVVVYQVDGEKQAASNPDEAWAAPFTWRVGRGPALLRP